MDLMQMLPLLMMMQGGGNQKRSGGAGGGGLDMASMMQLMSMMNGAQPFGTGKPNKGSPNNGEPLDMDMSKLQGMLSPEMLALLSSLGRKS